MRHYHYSLSSAVVSVIVTVAEATIYQDSVITTRLSSRERAANLWSAQIVLLGRSASLATVALPLEVSAASQVPRLCSRAPGHPQVVGVIDLGQATRPAEDLHLRAS